MAESDCRICSDHRTDGVLSCTGVDACIQNKITILGSQRAGAGPVSIVATSIKKPPSEGRLDNQRSSVRQYDRSPRPKLRWRNKQ